MPINSLFLRKKKKDNACYFLELIDENLKLTSLGEDIMKDPKRAKVRIYEQIIKNELWLYLRI